MWGGVFLETIFNGNHTFSFLTFQNINLLHLSQWQYWFWFFFTWFFGLYYIIFVSFFSKRVFSMNPKIATSFRSHGKWGDFIVCLIPISWCLNILTNSNYILRLVEWQSESYSFSLRVRGKQWYWVYKLTNTNTFFSQNNTYNVGNSNWLYFSGKNNNTLLNFLSGQVKSPDQLSYVDFYTTYKSFLNKSSFNVSAPFGSTYCFNLYSPKSPLDFNIGSNSVVDSHEFSSIFIGAGDFNGSLPLLNSSSSSSPKFTLEDFEVKPTTLSMNHPINYFGGIFSDNFSDNTSNSKEILDPVYVILKQKRFHYKSFKSLFTKSSLIYNDPKRYFMHPHLKNFLFDKYLDNKRLLRTFRLLVLPTNVNISVITNSFDVIHSWFIPGLGLKLDCVPGRSTHHTLHIINPGFYYGQCAEICGRFHHHMPIRLVALQYPQFIFWWHNKGVKQLINVRYKGNNNSSN